MMDLLSDEDMGIASAPASQPSGTTSAAAAPSQQATPLLSDEDMGIPGPLTRAVANVPAGAKDQPKDGKASDRSAIGDFFKSIPGGVVGGLSGEASALGQAAQIEMGQPVDVPDAATTKGQIEQNVTGQLPEPHGAAGQYGQRIGEVLGSPSTYVAPGGLGAKVMGGVVSAVGSEAAGQATQGTPYEAPARVAGAIIAPVGLGTVARVGGAVADAGTGIAKSAVQPLTKAGQEQMAADRLRAAATDPDAVAAGLQNGPKVVVPGSIPTVDQQTGDYGIGLLKRELETKNPVPFVQRAADQATARDIALNSVQPAGSAEDAAAAVRGHFANLQNLADQAIQEGTQQAQDKTIGLGAGVAPEVAGNKLRATLQAATDAAEQRTQGLWQTVDPDETLALAPQNTVQTAKDIVSSMPAAAKPMSGEEKGIFDVVGQLGQYAPLSEVDALRKRVGDAMRTEFEAGNGQGYNRLKQLNSAIHDDLAGAVAGKVADDQAAVAAGQMAPEQTLSAALQREIQQWRANRNEQFGTDGPGGASSTAGIGAQGVLGSPRAKGQANVGFGYAPSNPRLSADAANFDQGALDRLTSARAATKSDKQIFYNDTLGPMLERPGPSYPYNKNDTFVAQHVFVPGPKGFETVQTYRKAVSDPDALDALQGYAVDRLRQTAMKPDGTIDPAKVTAFRKQYGDALRAFPDLDAKFSNAAAATQALAEQSATVKQQLDNWQKGIVGKVMGLDHAQDVTNAVGRALGSDNAVQQMTKLSRAVAGNTDGQDGLRKAITDHMVQKLKSATEAGTSGVKHLKSGEYQKFIGKSVPALKAAGFSDEQIGMLKNIGEDLVQSNRTIALKGRSTTAQDVTLLSRISHALTTASPAAVGAAIGHFVPFVGTLAGGALGHVYAGFREAGIRNVDDILTDAVLNPERGKLLLSKASTPKQVRSLSKQLGNLYRRTAIQSGVQIAPRRISDVQGSGQGIGPSVVAADQDNKRQYLDTHTSKPVPQERINAIRAALAAKARQAAPGVGAMRSVPPAAVQFLRQNANNPNVVHQFEDKYKIPAGAFGVR